MLRYLEDIMHFLDSPMLHLSRNLVLVLLGLMIFPAGAQVVEVYEGRKLAIVVGINRYPIKRLDYAVADAQKVAEKLGELGFEVTLILDEEATREKIFTVLGTELKQTKPEDRVLFYFAGHGLTEVHHRE